MLLPTSISLLSSLLTIVTAIPTTKRAGSGIPADIQAPSAGHCAVLVVSQALLPLGGSPTSESGDGIGPSEQGSPEVIVINIHKDVVGGPAALKPQSPGFAASVPLNSNLILKAQTLSVTASSIAVGDDNWQIKYQYAGQKYSCNGDCNGYNEDTGGLGVYEIRQGFFPC